MSLAHFPTLIHVWIAALFAAILLRTFLMPVPPNDVWWQLAMGRLIVETGGIPTHDVFSFTQAGQPYYDQPWLAQLLMYGLHRVGGVPLLLVVQAALVSLAYAILLRLCVLRTGAAKLSVGLLLLTMLVTATSWTPRARRCSRCPSSSPSCSSCRIGVWGCAGGRRRQAAVPCGCCRR